MENPQERALSTLSPNVAMDWFGRSLCGHVAISNFFRARTSNVHLTIDHVVKIPPISHRLLKQASAPMTRTPVKECGQGDCVGKYSTPENSVQVNFQELLKAPRVKRCRPTFHQGIQFVEIQGKLEMKETDDAVNTTEKDINRIVLGYSDQINLIVFEGKKSCKKILFPL